MQQGRVHLFMYEAIRTHETCKDRFFLFCWLCNILFLIYFYCSIVTIPLMSTPYFF